MTCKRCGGTKTMIYNGYQITCQACATRELRPDWMNVDTKSIHRDQLRRMIDYLRARLRFEVNRNAKLVERAEGER